MSKLFTNFNWYSKQSYLTKELFINNCNTKGLNHLCTGRHRPSAPEQETTWPDQDFTWIQSAREKGSRWVAGLFSICTPSLIPRLLTPTQVNIYKKSLYELWPHVWYLVSAQHTLLSFLWLTMTLSVPLQTLSNRFSGYFTILWGRNVCTCVGKQTTEFSKWKKLGLRSFFFLPPKFTLRWVTKFPLEG